MMLAEHLIHVPQYGTVSLLELAWTISGVMLLTVVAANLHDLFDEIGLRPGVRGAKERQASIVIVRSYYRREFIRLFKAVIVTVIGVVADIAPNLTEYTNTTGIVLTVGLFILSLLIGLQSILDRIDRHRVSRIIVGEESAKFGRRWDDEQAEIAEATKGE